MTKEKTNKAAAKYRRTHVLRLRRIVDGIKQRPCMDCQGWFNPWQMDFDHRESVLKLHNIGRFVSQGHRSAKRLLAEIAKCDVVCANCHRDRTQKRRMLAVLNEVN